MNQFELINRQTKTNYCGQLSNALKSKEVMWDKMDREEFVIQGKTNRWEKRRKEEKGGEGKMLSFKDEGNGKNMGGELHGEQIG